jgi:outer membrane protein assembly factor BamD (BamD/ComL family)
MNSFVDLGRRAAIVCLGVAALGALAGAQTPEEFARRRIESGRAFLRAQNYAEALKDFEAVLQSYPTSGVADDALLEIATYQLEIAHDPGAADLRAKELLKSYPASDSAAMALVLEGRVALARARTPEAVSTALASFDRVPRLFPGSDAVPASMYYAGESLRIGNQREQAIERFSQLTRQFPNSPWTANALLGSAVSLTRSGQATRAMEQLQRVRTQFPRSPESAIALDWNTVLYRLYVRAPSQPAFLFSGRTIAGPGGKLKDAIDVAILPDSNVLVASKTSVAAYGTKGNVVSSVGAIEPLTLQFDRRGGMMTVHETGIRLDAKTPLVVLPPVFDGHARELKVSDGLAMASGEYLIADRNQKNILKFGADGRYLGEFARQDVRRMAIDELDDVVALDGGTKTVTLYNRDGKMLKQIAERGTNYQLRDPSDVAFDGLGHVYVLDRSAVLVFSSDGGKLLTTFAVPEKAAGAIGDGSALALDTAGRLYVLDGKSDSVKVYR